MVSLPESANGEVLRMPPPCWASQVSEPVGQSPRAAAFASESHRPGAPSPLPPQQQLVQQQQQQQQQQQLLMSQQQPQQQQERPLPQPLGISQMQPQQLQVGEALPTAGSCAWELSSSPWCPQQQQQQQQQEWHRLVSAATPASWVPKSSSAETASVLRVSETASFGRQRPDTIAARQVARPSHITHHTS
ncbi:hypothetical protein Vretimale_689 [Volvox reticuliferus]|uniref:Uncharacterized protein n=1 Tax=Volvox reticuliferus TaxID=1737510 RepID=A0A8J4G191_9CHLO|nr:hypothetical protein Vretimale_689 [Volvox reticuliferus]